MELSKMGPPLNSSTATTSRRRRPASFLAVSGDAAAESWLMALSPLGVRGSPFLSGLSLLHFSPRFCTSPQPSIRMIESTASRGAGVTSPAPSAMSTRQLGAKLSITKRFTRGPRRGSAPHGDGPYPYGARGRNGPFLPGGKGVGRPFGQGIRHRGKLAENIRVQVCDRLTSRVYIPPRDAHRDALPEPVGRAVRTPEATVVPVPRRLPARTGAAAAGIRRSRPSGRGRSRTPPRTRTRTR